MKKLLSLLLFLAVPASAEITCVPRTACSGSSSGGVTVSGNNDFTGTNTFIDATTWIIGSADPTKRARFEVDGFTASNDRVFTLPGTTGNATIATTGINTFTGTQTISATDLVMSGTGGRGIYVGGLNTTGGVWLWSTALTPDASIFATGSTSNSFHVAESTDIAFDFQNCSAGTSAATNPTLCIHSADGASTTKWLDAKHDGTNGVIDVGTGVVSIPDGITTAGTVISTRTSDLGWSVVAGANTACTTTCTHAAVLGFDTAVSAVPVGPADATADICLCAGAN